jgi:hypothetical protein
MHNRVYSSSHGLYAYEAHIQCASEYIRHAVLQHMSHYPYTIELLYPQQQHAHTAASYHTASIYCCTHTCLNFLTTGLLTETLCSLRSGVDRYSQFAFFLLLQNYCQIYCSSARNPSNRTKLFSLNAVCTALQNCECHYCASAAHTVPVIDTW